MRQSESTSERLVVVHQMGKVGSSAVFEALRDLGGMRVEFTHMLNRESIGTYIRHKRSRSQEIPSHVRSSVAIWRSIRHTDQPIDFICAVRSPMARNISAMFQNLPPRFSTEPTPANLDEVGQRFMKRYPHSTPLGWFDHHVQEPLGLDVYSQPFDHETKSLFVQRGRYRVLVLRAEDSDDQKQEALARHLGITGLEICRANVASEKGYGALYKAFVQSFEPPEWLIEKCYRSKFCEHFYTAAEINRFRTRWERSAAADSEAA